MIDDPVPRFMLATPKVRRSRGFSLKRIRDLLGPESASTIAGWLPAQRRLARARGTALRIVAACRRDIEGYSTDLESLTDVAHIQNRLAGLGAAIRAVSDELPRYLMTLVK